MYNDKQCSQVTTRKNQAATFLARDLVVVGALATAGYIYVVEHTYVQETDT